MKVRTKVQATTIGVVIALTLVTVGAGPFNCNMSNPLISGVSFKPEPNLETVEAKLNFGSLVQSSLGGSFAVKDYGTIEISPWTSTSPFSVGFRLNTEVLNDQDYLSLKPTTVLPSGEPLPAAMNRAMAQVSLKNELNPNFNLYLYVDVLGDSKGVHQWVGLAMTFKALSAVNLPIQGIAISQGFLPDKAGNPQAAAAIFGPSTDGKTQGGIALFANIVSLAKGGAVALAGFEGTENKPFTFDGPLAPYYRAHPNEAYQIGEAIKILLNSNAGAM